MLNQVSIKAIQIFEAAARLSSFSLAAQELCITPSAVSHQIKLLEDQFGVKLFHRVHKAVVLTDAGRRYSEEVSTAFCRIEKATRELELTQKSDILTVNTTVSFAAQWLIPRLPRFSARYPNIDVRLNSTFPVTDKILDMVDVDIHYGLKEFWPPDIAVSRFPADKIVPLCSPNLANGAHRISSPEDLRHHILIHSELCVASWRDWLQLYPGLDLDLSRGPRFNRSFLAISMAVDGVGVCLDNLLLAQHELKTGKLIAPLGLEGITVQCYNLNFLKARAKLPKIVYFQNWLFEELEKMGTLPIY